VQDLVVPRLNRKHGVAYPPALRREADAGGVIAEDGWPGAGVKRLRGAAQSTMTACDGPGAEFEREEVWVTPDPSRMPHCKVCKTQGCMHFRRGFAHLLALNQVLNRPRVCGCGLRARRDTSRRDAKFQSVSHQQSADGSKPPTCRPNPVQNPRERIL
jgi:hypothetical protein